MGACLLSLVILVPIIPLIQQEFGTVELRVLHGNMHWQAIAGIMNQGGMGVQLFYHTITIHIFWGWNNKPLGNAH